MKLVGALFVVVAATLLGVSKASALGKREKTLAAVIAALGYVRCELQSAATPLPELLGNLRSRSQVELANFYDELSAFGGSGESFEDAWTKAVGCAALCLSEGQKRELSRLGQYLGRFPGGAQCEAIDACLSHLKPEHEAARAAARQGKKLWTGLGLAAGLMLAAVLI